MHWSELWDRLVSIIYPSRCVLCGEIVEYDDLTCPKCAFERQGEKQCSGYAFAACIVTTVYQDTVKDAVLRVKNCGDQRAVKFFAQEMKAAMEQYWGCIEADCIVFVPSTNKHMREQGFNHAQLLARALADRCGLPVIDGALIRRENSMSQHELGAKQRWENAAHSYLCANTAFICGKAVILVDDVFTTGATANACANKLLEVGASKVYVITATGIPEK